MIRHIKRNIMRAKLVKHGFNKPNKALREAWHQYFTNPKVREMLDK